MAGDSFFFLFFFSFRKSTRNRHDESRLESKAKIGWRRCTRPKARSSHNRRRLSRKTELVYHCIQVLTGHSCPHLGTPPVLNLAETNIEATIQSIYYSPETTPHTRQSTRPPLPYRSAVCGLPYGVDMVLRRHTTCLLVEVVDEPAAQDAFEGWQCCGDVDRDAAPCRACFDEDAEVVVDGILVLSVRTSVHQTYLAFACHIHSQRPLVLTLVLSRLFP